MEMIKRIITPHKGGRDCQIQFRVTSKEFDLINLSRGAMGLADFVMKLIKEKK
jgi:hypothetical protein